MAESKLTDLIAKLEAATEGSRELDCIVLDCLGFDLITERMGAYWCSADLGALDDAHGTPTTSLDAIVGLIERKLPESALVMATSSPPWVQVYLSDDPGSNLDAVSAATLPLAACIALLSALQLQGGSEQ